MEDAIVLQKTGNPQSIVRHWLARGTLNAELEGLLGKLCDYMRIEAEPYLEKNTSTQSRLNLVLYIVPLHFK